MENGSKKKVQDILVEARHYKQLAAKERSKGRIKHAQEMEYHVQRLNQEAHKKAEEDNAKMATVNSITEPD